jgi:hypothetical protein
VQEQLRIISIGSNNTGTAALCQRGLVDFIRAFNQTKACAKLFVQGIRIESNYVQVVRVP